MELYIYKGFDLTFLKSIGKEPLIDGDIEDKLNPLSFNKSIKKQLKISLLNMDGDEKKWATYEEYTQIINDVDDKVLDEDLKVTIYKNNIYPDFYPVPFDINEDLYNQLCDRSKFISISDESGDCKKILEIYSEFIKINNLCYGSYHNLENLEDKGNGMKCLDYYPTTNEIKNKNIDSDYDLIFNNDVETFLKQLIDIQTLKPKVIAVKPLNQDAARRMLSSLKAYCQKNNIELILFKELLPEEKEINDELIKIAREDIGISSFKDFRNIKFYKAPDESKETIEISQGQIIREIIKQAELSYNEETRRKSRDIFITASTGAGKSVMFQIPSVYLAKKYNKLTIIIEPVKALMQDQKEKLRKSGYTRVETFNSDLISQIEKEKVIQKIKNNEVDLLYLSPETLLSYSIESLIGDREIGLLIVDEAHIVTTWGIGFRPDYWYLGGYLNRLRNQIQTYAGKKRKTYNFPVCAFTATAVNGGIDDSVGDTIESLYMNNPIRYIGYVRRDDISFDVIHKNDNKMSRDEYENAKANDLSLRIIEWIDKKEKTIVYFPYASQAKDAYIGLNQFTGIYCDKANIGLYTGRNIDGVSAEIFADSKQEVLREFRDGKKTVMYATKAFGMGVDINDIKNIYHYAPSGTLFDYVQEIGRAARKETINGVAIIDSYYNDYSYMKSLFGMSSIKEYQIKAVLEGIYNVYKNKNSRNFLISPESFTYIFGKQSKDDKQSEKSCINKLKTCLLMIEKDFYEKNNYKVIVSRPQSVFTKAFVCIKKEYDLKVKNSKYFKYFKFEKQARDHERRYDRVQGSIVTDMGDIYSVDLKGIWEEFHSGISFPQFKYYFFSNNGVETNDNIMMPEIRKYLIPRQKIQVEAKGNKILSEIRQAIYQDFEYISNMLNSNFGKSYFTTDEFIAKLSKRFDKSVARIIGNSLFELVDPEMRHVKRRINEATGAVNYSLIGSGTFIECMRKPISKSSLVGSLTMSGCESNYTSFVNLMGDETTAKALKLLSIFNYITYDVQGGEEPEIFIRLNSPEVLRRVIVGSFYKNSYIKKAKEKHGRDVEILMNFFIALDSSKERWDYIEDYFLGKDVLAGREKKDINPTKMLKLLDKEHSYQTSDMSGWSDIENYLTDEDFGYLKPLIEYRISIPEYITTILKKSEYGDEILLSWPSRDILICKRNATERAMDFFKSKAWHAYRVDEIDYEKILEEFK